MSREATLVFQGYLSGPDSEEFVRLSDETYFLYLRVQLEDTTDPQFAYTETIAGLRDLGAYVAGRPDPDQKGLTAPEWADLVAKQVVEAFNR